MKSVNEIYLYNIFTLLKPYKLLSVTEKIKVSVSQKRKDLQIYVIVYKFYKFSQQRLFYLLTVF